ncbi:TNF receptor-associated factor 3-like [Orbicella faveolata]|uniref:TNF receptor-associated factor 3-like n=1 Tax=Orbicella faveolata TaxID=48498 RepID=UPI0009E45713|nr:TNF receptor-associated factor 3-like [Orbicella faveolata]
MVEAPGIPLPSGYGEDFVDALEDENLCVICYLPLKKPVLTRCGHRFCKECLEEHFRRCGLVYVVRLQCHLDFTHLASCLFRDVPCINDNCQVTLKWKDLSEHVSVTCQWRIILCEHCNEPHPKCQMEDHVREKCKLRPLPCPFKCGALNLRDKELQDHLKTCERFPLRCPNNCEEVVSREMVSNHIKDYCPLTKMPCPFAWMGCCTEVQRDELESHLECATKSHLDLACGELRDTQEKVKEQITHFDRLEERGRILDEQLEEKVDDIQDQLRNNVDFLQRQHQRRVGILQEQLEQEQKIRRKISTIFSICLVLGLVFFKFYLTKLEDTVQKNLEEKVSVIQSLHEKNMVMIKKDLEDKFQKKLEEKVSAIQSLHEKNMGMVKKDLEDRFQKKLEKVSVIQSMHEKNVGMVKKDLEDSFQKKLEKVSVIQSLHEKNMVMIKKDLEDKFQKKLEEKVSAIQSLHEKNMGMVKKDLEDRFQKKLEKVSVIQSMHEKNVGMVKKDLEDKFESLNTYLSNRLLILELHTEVSHDFIWKITSFENKLRQGKNKEKRLIDSFPFYAYGYKLMLRLYPDGDGAGENTHLSIFIAVMKGEYDAILPKGFTKRVKITLIDQQDNPNERQNVVMGFNADPPEKSFERTAEGEIRLGWGFPQFVSHNDLRTRRFLVDDTLFIKVQVYAPKTKASRF